MRIIAISLEEAIKKYEEIKKQQEKEGKENSDD